jgi:hypothetical protein
MLDNELANIPLQGIFPVSIFDFAPPSIGFAQPSTACFYPSVTGVAYIGQTKVMSNSNRLRQFHYSVSSSALAVSEENYPDQQVDQRPLLNVVIDFEKGDLLVEGFYTFIMAFNQQCQLHRYRPDAERLKIIASILPACTLDLEDPQINGTVCNLKGIISDEYSRSLCSGLLVIDTIGEKVGLYQQQWNIKLFIYDIQFDNCELQFKLPLFLHAFNDHDN